MERLRFQLVTPERRLLDIECDEVQLPGSEGYFGVLPGHTPLVALLKIGEASYREGRRESFVAIGEGFAEVSDDIVTVLCDFAEFPSEINLGQAEKDRAQAEEELKTAGVETFEVIHARLETAVTRMRVAGRR